MADVQVGKRRLTRQEFLIAGAGAGVLLVGGCGSGEGSTTSGEVKVWGWDIAAASLREIVPMFQEKYPDIEVNVQDVGRLDLYEKATTGLAAGGVGLPDVFMLESDRLPSYISQFPDGIANLSKRGAGKFRDQIADSKWPMAMMDGDIYAMPWDIGPAGVFYRTDFFEEAGVDPKAVETWDDFYDAGQKIKDATGTRLFGVDKANDDGIFRMMLNEQSTYYFDEDGAITLNSPEAIKAMGLLKRFSDADLMLNINGYDGGVLAVKNGKVATAPAGVWYSGTIMSQAPDQKGNWDAFLLPAVERGGNRSANLGGSNLVINASSENLEAAYTYARFAMTDPDAQVYMMKNYGLFPSLLETYDNPFFNKSVAYFNDEPTYQMFAEEVPDIPKAYYTEDYARALERSVNAQAQVLLDNGNPEKALDEAAKQLAQETGRKLAYEA